MRHIWFQARIAFMLGVVLMLLFQWWNRVPEPPAGSIGIVVQVPCSIHISNGEVCLTTIPYR